VLFVREAQADVQETQSVVEGTSGEDLMNQETAPVVEEKSRVDQETAPLVEVPRVIEETTPAIETQSPGETKKRSDVTCFSSALVKLKQNYNMS
jgi:hypothetical protein